MGQAFDREGNVLGEATGETKREVLDALQKKFGEAAHEIRIKSMRDDVPSEQNDPRAGTLAPDRMLQFFTYAHLPQNLAEASRPFCDLAQHIVATLPSNAERTVALRKLLEAKDCAVRALLQR